MTQNKDDAPEGANETDRVIVNPYTGERIFLKELKNDKGIVNLDD